MKAVRNVRYLCYIRVYWENYKKRRKATQCFKCQRFGHTAEYCNNDPRCVKCDQPHLTKESKRVKGAHPPKCTNCGGEHSANYTMCPVYLKHLAKMETRQISKQRQPKRTTTQAPTMTNENFPPLPKFIWLSQPTRPAQPIGNSWATDQNQQCHNLSELQELMAANKKTEQAM